MSSTVSASPFEDGQPFTAASLSTISFEKLVNHDRDEQAKLLKCGEQDGFVYLDLTSPASQGLWQDYQAVLATMADFFAQPEEKKLPYNYNSDIQGYKPLGHQTGATEMSRDGFETIRVHVEGLDMADKPLPPHLMERKELFQGFIDKARMHVAALFSSFSDAIGLEGAERFEKVHDHSLPSNSSMTFHRYPRRDTRGEEHIGHNKHTDVGSLTFLLAQQWGLQVPAPSQSGLEDSTTWTWVRPKPGHAVINVGDSLRFISGMRLRSVLHRVVPTQEMEHTHRYSIAYFCRPAHGTMFKDSEGRLIACNEWFKQKFTMLRASHAEQRSNSILTGGIENSQQRNQVLRSLVAA